MRCARCRGRSPVRLRARGGTETPSRGTRPAPGRCEPPPARSVGRGGPSSTILGHQIDTVAVRAPGEPSTDLIGDRAGFDGATPRGGLENLLELGLEGTSVPPR